MPAGAASTSSSSGSSSVMALRYSGWPCALRWATIFSTSASETNGPWTRRDAAAARHVEHVALAEQLLGALLAEDGAAVDLARHLERDAGREIRLDRAGDDVDRRALGRHDEVDAGGARHLRQALDRALDVLAGDHHQVGHFVDDDDDVGQFVELHLLLLVDRLAGLAVEAGLHRAGHRLALGARLGDARVEAVDVAHADLRHLLVAVLHLAHRPFERDDRLLRIGDDGGQQMRNAVVDGELEHLRIDHDQPALLGLQAIEQATSPWC